MRTTRICLLLIAPLGIAVAQQGAAPAALEMRTFTSSAEVQSLIAQCKAEYKGTQPMLSKRLLSLAPYNVNLEYRPVGGGGGAVHPKEAEMFYIIEGTGTFVSGGKIVGGKIEGGDSREVAKGDFFVIPENTPHTFSAIKETVVVMTLHLPRPVPSQP